MPRYRFSLYRRFWEIFPAALSYGILIIPIALSFTHPKVVAVFVVLYSFLWFLRSVEYAVFLLASFWKFQKVSRIDWQKKLECLESGTALSAIDHAERTARLAEGDFISPSRVKHIVIIATCGETIDILRETFRSLFDSKYDLRRIFVCLATEALQSESGRAHAKTIQEEFGSRFGRFFWSEHPGNIPGEVRGKGGNITYAGRMIAEVLTKEGCDLSEFLVTTLDADNKTDLQYFPCLTYHFCLQKERERKSYQPIPLFYNNIWDVPMLNRMLAISSGFWHMIESGRPDRLRNFSSHAQPLQALRDMDFWSVDTIVEDGHQFWRSYFHFRGDYEVIPLFIPIYQDAVLNKTYYRSLVGQYKQMRRWAWGCSDIPFFAVKCRALFRELPFVKTLIHFVRLVEGHIMWATAAIFITLTSPVPRMINATFRETNVAVNMAYLLQNFFVMAILGILISMGISLLTLPKAPTKAKRFSLVWQWILLPFMTILMGSFPALDAQTRLAINRPLEFNITEKVRIPIKK